jgi:hypothetical protein
VACGRIFRQGRLLRVAGGAGTDGGGPRDDLSQSFVIEPIGGRHPRPAIADHPHAYLGIVLGDVLVDAGVGESRQGVILGAVDGFGLRAGDAGERPIQDAGHRLGVVQRSGHHRPTPTCTLRNLAGLAPCPTCPVCIGSPLPQFGTPHRTHSSGPQIASQLPQNCGVIPV